MSAEPVPFEPKGSVPEWRLIYDCLPRDFDALITFEQLDEALGRPFLENRNPIYRAGKELLKRHDRALEPVRGIGYRVVHPGEQTRLARHNQRSARRKMGKAVDIISHVDVRGLDSAQRSELQVVGHAIRTLAHAHAQLARRHVVLEERVTRVEEATTAFPTSNDVEILRQRVEALEKERRGSREE